MSWLIPPPPSAALDSPLPVPTLKSRSTGQNGSWLTAAHAENYPNRSWASSDEWHVQQKMLTGALFTLGIILAERRFG